ncbi:hypothetical protein FPV67DRAFT_1026055 [Lyophyllum atratum]|nr:hypothetical protein FPV67DRAFT_1026055 [Lyophyllum atratum]
MNTLRFHIHTSLATIDEIMRVILLSANQNRRLQSTSYRPQADQHQPPSSTSSMRDAAAARNLMHHLPVPDPGFRDASRPSVSKNLAQNAGSSSTYRIHDAGTAETRRPQKAPFLMLTLLIQDIRSGVTDHQLAEVRLPMKPANDPSDGFWADAKLLGQQLQSSASRIDGPAKVYTLRGKYRQFFLRVTAENADEFISTHLAIKPDRMLDVVVEEVRSFLVDGISLAAMINAIAQLLPPGQLPLPPQIPRNLIKSPTPDSSSSSPTPEEETFQELPFERQRNQDRIMRDFEELRRLQQSSERAGSSSSRGSAQSGTGGRKPKKANPQKRKRSTDRRPKSSEPMPIAPKPAVTVHSGDNMPRFDSPDPDDSPEEVHRLVTSAVDQIVQD